MCIDTGLLTNYLLTNIFRTVVSEVSSFVSMYVHICTCMCVYVLRLWGQSSLNYHHATESENKRERYRINGRKDYIRIKELKTCTRQDIQKGVTYLKYWRLNLRNANNLINPLMVGLSNSKCVSGFCQLLLLNESEKQVHCCFKMY